MSGPSRREVSPVRERILEKNINRGCSDCVTLSVLAKDLLLQKKNIRRCYK